MKFAKLKMKKQAKQINWEKSEKIDFMKSLKDSNHLIYYRLLIFN